MPRGHRTGAIYPIKYEQRKRLRSGGERTYTRYHAKVDGKWVSGRTYKECDEKIRKALRERVTWGAASNHSATLGPYAREWFDMHKQTLDPNSRKNYRIVIERHLKPYENLKLADVNPTVVRRMLDRMTAWGRREASVNSKNMMRAALALIFKSAVADHIIPTNPVEYAPLSKGKDRPVFVRSREMFTDEQVAAMLREAAKDLRDGAIEWFRLLTGMRQGEILGAVLEDLKLFPTDHGVWEGYYTVNWQLQPIRRQHGCGEPDGSGRYPCGYLRRGSYRCPQAVWDVPPGFDFIPLDGSLCLVRPKTGKPRIVPLPPMLATALHRYVEHVGGEPNPHGLLFHTPDGRPFTAAQDRERFRDLMRRAGIPNADERHGHECRRTVVSKLSSEGVDPGKIQRIIGHSSIAMTEYYRDIPQEELLAGMEKLDEAYDLKRIGGKTE